MRLGEMVSINVKFYRIFFPLPKWWNTFPKLHKSSLKGYYK